MSGADTACLKTVGLLGALKKLS